jgi:hypothetical protein
MPKRIISGLYGFTHTMKLNAGETVIRTDQIYPAQLGGFQAIPE